MGRKSRYTEYAKGIAHVNTEQLVKAFQESIKMSDEKIREANKIAFVKELMEEAI